MFSTVSNTIISTTIEGIQVRLESKPLDGMDTHAKKIGNKVVLGYIDHALHSGNPLEECDGMGRIFTCSRFGSSIADFRNALGLNVYGSPDIEIVRKHPELFKATWIDEACERVEFQVWCKKSDLMPKNMHEDAEKTFFRQQAETYWVLTGGCDPSPSFGDPSIYSFNFTDLAEIAVWKKLRKLGEIGDMDAVMLSVYEHSGVAYSISGEGMNCQFDTSPNGAVWVPDDCAREEITRRAEVYQYGELVEKQVQGSSSWKFSLDGSEIETGSYSQWYECFSAAQQLIKKQNGILGNSATGRHRAAIEIARSAAEDYTDYCNGEVYSIVIETHEVIDGSYAATTVASEITDGVFGSIHAEAELLIQFNSEVKQASELH